MSTHSRSLIIDVLLILALGVIAVLGYHYSPLLLPKADLTLMPTEGCDLNRQACSARMPGDTGHVELSLSPRPLPVVKPLQVVATLNGIDASKVELDFSGVDMEMGYNRMTLKPDGQGHFVGQAMIPVCVTGRMLWRATLMIEAERRRIAVPYLFEAPWLES